MSILKVKAFCEKYNVSDGSLYCQRSQGNSKYTFEENGTVYIDESKIIEMRDKKRKLWNISHTYFYYFTYVIGIREFELAKQIEKRGFGKARSFTTFFSSVLFRIDDGSILSLSISGMRIKFVQFCDIYIPMIHEEFKNEELYKNRLKDLI